MERKLLTSKTFANSSPGLQQPWVSAKPIPAQTLKFDRLPATGHVIALVLNSEITVVVDVLFLATLDLTLGK